MPSKAGWVLIAAAVGVVGVLAYMAYRTLKPVADVTGRIDSGLRGISRGFSAINGDFGAAAHAAQSPVAFGIDANKAIYGQAGAYLGTIFNKTQAPTAPPPDPQVTAQASVQAGVEAYDDYLRSIGITPTGTVADLNVQTSGLKLAAMGMVGGL